MSTDMTRWSRSTVPSKPLEKANYDEALSRKLSVRRIVVVVTTTGTMIRSFESQTLDERKKGEWEL